MGVAKFFEVVIGGIFTTLILAAFAWFAGPAVWKHLVEAEGAKATVATQAAAIKADAQSAQDARTTCSAEIAASVQAGAAIARVARPVAAPAAKQPQPMLTAKDIQDAIQ